MRRHGEQDQRCCEQAGLTLSDGVTTGDFQDVQANFDADAAARCLDETARMACPRAKDADESFRPETPSAA